MEPIKWEYCVTFFHPDKEYTRFTIKQELNIYGEDGWELVNVDGGTAYFKRPICKGENEDE